MSSARWGGGFVLLMIGLGCGVSAAQVATRAASAEQLQRGQYLVEHVAMCVQCHTPRNAQGELDRTRLLQGAPVPVPAPFPTPQWAFEAPRIAGLPGWLTEDAVRLLQTGRSARGYTPRPPMPPFRMTQEDAAAVVAYLKSLP
jgi:mono/diheme cytochrome c family protein